MRHSSFVSGFKTCAKGPKWKPLPGSFQIHIKLRLHGTRQAVRLRRDGRAAKAFTRRQAVWSRPGSRRATAASPGGILSLNRHRLSRAFFLEKHRPQKLPIHGLYARVACDSCLPCKRYCRPCKSRCNMSHASRAACRLSCKRTFMYMIDSISLQIWKQVNK